MYTENTQPLVNNNLDPYANNNMPDQNNNSSPYVPNDNSYPQDNVPTQNFAEYRTS